MNFKKISLLMCAMIMLVYALSGCSKFKKSKNENDFPVTVCGVTIENAPKKVVVLSDSIADIVIGLKETSKICAKSDECTQEALTHLPSVGSELDPDVEAIKSFKADVVLYDKDLSQGKIDALHGVTLVKIEKANNRNDLEALYNNVAMVLKGEESGREQAKTFSKSVLYSLDEISRIIPVQTVPPTLCYLFDENGKTVTDGTFANKIIESIRAINVASDIKDGVIVMSELRLANPTYVFCDKGVKEKLLENDVFSELDAVKNNHIFELDKVLLMRQGESIVEAAKAFAADMYPELMLGASSMSNTTTNEEVEENTESITEPTTTSKVVESKEVPDASNIMRIQERLDELCYLHTAPNGVMDDSSKQAIKDFKYLNGQEVNDIIDTAFLNALFSSEAKVRPDPARIK